MDRRMLIKTLILLDIYSWNQSIVGSNIQKDRRSCISRGKKNTKKQLADFQLSLFPPRFPRKAKTWVHLIQLFMVLTVHSKLITTTRNKQKKWNGKRTKKIRRWKKHQYNCFVLCRDHIVVPVPVTCWEHARTETVASYH